MENNYIYRLKINMFEQGFSTSYIDKEYMYGKAYYIKMIEPDLGEEYLRRLDAIRW